MKPRKTSIVVRFKRLDQFAKEEIARAASEEDWEELGSGIRLLHRLVANHGICSHFIRTHVIRNARIPKSAPKRINLNSINQLICTELNGTTELRMDAMRQFEHQRIESD